MSFVHFYPVFVLLAISFEANGEFTPMVAFMCNKPSMYVNENGWHRVEDTNCLHDPVEILNFCRRVYFDKQVTNVVESSVKVTIGNWCQVDKPNCRHPEHTVTPYKCVVGAFQSEALLVPEHCVFDHLHDDRACQAVTVWQDTATKSCLSRGLALESSAPLSVCGVARFHGVEFVCCQPAAAGGKKNEQVTSEENSEEKQETDVYNKYLHSVGGKYDDEHDLYSRAREDLASVHKDKMAKVMKEWTAARQNVHQLKKSDPAGAVKLESQVTERFQKAYSMLNRELVEEKKQLSNIHEQRVQAKLNEKKTAAMDSYMDELNDDSSEARDIVKALQAYIRVEQKDRLHTVNRYQRVLDTDLDDAQALRPQVIEHLKVVSKRIEQAVSMLSRVPKLEKNIRSQIDSFMKNSFSELDVSIAAILGEPVTSLLDEKVLPEVNQKMQAKVVAKSKPAALVVEKHEQVVKKDGVENSAEWDVDSSSYEFDVDDEDDGSYKEDEGVLADEPKISIVPAESLLADAEKAEASSEESKKIDIVSEETMLDEAEKFKDEDDTKVSVVSAEAMLADAKNSAEDEDSSKVRIVSEDALLESANQLKAAVSSNEHSEEFDDEVVEDEHSLLEDIDAPPVAAHHEVAGLSAEAPSVSRGMKALETSAGKGAVVSIIVATITLFIVLAVGVAILRQKSRWGGAEMEVEEVTPEDGHVNAMQVNGYENPTYKYFENKA